MGPLQKAGIHIRRDCVPPDLAMLHEHMLPIQWRLHVVREQKDPATCAHEHRNMNGGCDECGDPSL